MKEGGEGRKKGAISRKQLRKEGRKGGKKERYQGIN
jgi:hypothetical protein